MPTYKYLDKDGLEHFWGKVDAAKQDKLIAGANISIDADNEISATDTTYSAGTGIDINSGTVSVDTTVIAEKSDIGDATLTIQKNGTAVDTFTANATSNKTINITVPTTAADVNALPSTTKYATSLSLTINSSTYVITGQLKDQDGNNLGTAQTIDLPLESVVVNGSYDSATKEVVLTLQNGNTVRFSVADLVSGLQTEITSANPLDADLVDDSTSTNKFVTSSDISTWNAKQDALTAGSNVQINGTTISATDTTYSAGSGLDLTGTTFSVDTTTIATKSDIPTVNDAILTIEQNGTTAGTFTANASSNSTISLTDTTYSNFVGASSSVAGSAGLVPAPAAGDDTKFLSGDGIWKTVSQYALPIATANDLGGIKVGSRLTINSSTGVLSADSQTDNNFTTALKDKLDGIASGAEVNVQANWTEADSSSDAYIQNKPSLATVATSGSYNDLTNKPTIPAAQVNSDWDANSGVAQILNKPSLATVATSGSYTDLINKPIIPTVNDATLTIQKNGTSVGTFTANASSNVTANIQTPDITVTGTDPGEGSALGQNEFIAVYGAPDYSDMIDVFYPVGSYYETSDTTFNPNTTWLGTTWVEDTAGRVLVAQDSGTFATVGDTGGEETHTLTVAEMPSHHHTIVPMADYNGSLSERHTTGWNKANSTSQNTSDVGGGGAHNNLQPYAVIKRWHRTS